MPPSTCKNISDWRINFNNPSYKLHELRFNYVLLQKYKVSINDVYSQRVLHLRDACLNSSDEFVGYSTDDTVGHNLHFDQSHNLLYCQIQKVGSTFIRNLLSKVIEYSTASKTRTSLMRLQNWKDLGFLKLHSVIQNSDKFMFVRDPYSRVLSGYVDKLFSPNI